MRIALVAGENSGDQLGAGLIRELTLRYSQATFYGIGGPRMRQAGMQASYDIEAISMIGLEGVFTKLPGIISIRRNLIKDFLADKPDIFIGIDVPDFNLTLEKILTRHAICCIHYVSPTIWAWRSYRINTIKQAVAHMLVLFPFEKEIYDRNGVSATCVGHPIADEVERVPAMAVCRKKHAINIESKVLALLPGSRASEINRHARLFLETARLLGRSNPQLVFALSAVNHSVEETLRQLLRRDFPDLKVTLITGNVREVIALSNLVLAASGTVTLETALMEKPLVMAYKVSKISELMVKYFARVKHYAMPNFLLDQPQVPEFVQQQATVANLSTALEHYLHHPEKCLDIINKFKAIKAGLKKNADVVAADVICSYLNQRQ